MTRHHFHNTTESRGAELARFELEAATQDEAVAAVYRKHAPFGLSPSQCHRALGTKAPLTSIRRAITNLAKAGVLVKTGEQVRGPFGKPEHRWKLKAEPKQERLL